MSAAPFSPVEEAELRALVYQAYELRDSPYMHDACQAIVDWYERLPLTRYERNQDAQMVCRQVSELVELVHARYGHQAAWKLVGAVAAFLDGDPGSLTGIAERLQPRAQARPIP